MSHRFRVVTTSKLESVIKTPDIERSYVNVLFHNKGMDKIDLPRILNSKRVISAVPKEWSPPFCKLYFTKTIIRR